MDTKSLLLAALLAGTLVGCAMLPPPQSTQAEVIAAMGEPALRTQAAGGETLLWYPRFPFGRQSLAARMSAQGRLIAIENRLTDDNIARLRVDETRKEKVLALIGPPYRVSRFERMAREVWDYPTPCRISCFLLIVQFSPDGVVREVYQVLDPEMLSRRAAASCTAAPQRNVGRRRRSRCQSLQSARGRAAVRGSMRAGRHMLRCAPWRTTKTRTAPIWNPRRCRAPGALPNAQSRWCSPFLRSFYPGKPARARFVN